MQAVQETDEREPVKRSSFPNRFPSHPAAVPACYLGETCVAPLVGGRVYARAYKIRMKLWDTLKPCHDTSGKLVVFISVRFVLRVPKGKPKDTHQFWVAQESSDIGRRTRRWQSQRHRQAAYCRAAGNGWIWRGKSSLRFTQHDELS